MFIPQNTLGNLMWGNECSETPCLFSSALPDVKGCLVQWHLCSPTSRAPESSAVFGVFSGLITAPWSEAGKCAAPRGRNPREEQVNLPKTIYSFWVPGTGMGFQDLLAPTPALMFGYLSSLKSALPTPTRLPESGHRRVRVCNNYSVSNPWVIPGGFTWLTKDS